MTIKNRVAFFVLLFLLAHLAEAASVYPRVSFLNVGQGNCVVVSCSEEERLLVDCGSYGKNGLKKSEYERTSSSSRPSTNDLKKFIKKFYIKTPKKVVILITHPDKDHFNLVEGLMDTASIREKTVLLGGPLEDYFTSEDSRDLMKHLRSKLSQFSFLSHDLSEEDIENLMTKFQEIETARKAMRERYNNAEQKSHIDKEYARSLRKYVEKTFGHKKRGSIFNQKLQDFLKPGTPAAVGSPSRRSGTEFCSSLSLDILSANAGQGDIHFPGGEMKTIVLNGNDNTNSVVLRVTHTKRDRRKQSIILTGDAEGVTTDQIEERYGDQLENTDIMLACHHGAYTNDSNSTSWIEKTSPKVVIFSADVGGQHHPRCDTVARYLSKAQRAATPHALTCSTHATKDKLNSILLPGYSFEKEETINFSSNGKVVTKYFKTERMNKKAYNTHNSGNITVYFEDTGLKASSEKIAADGESLSQTPLFDISLPPLSPTPPSTPPQAVATPHAARTPVTSAIASAAAPAVTPYTAGSIHSTLDSHSPHIARHTTFIDSGKRHQRRFTPGSKLTTPQKGINKALIAEVRRRIISGKPLNNIVRELSGTITLEQVKHIKRDMP